MLSNGYCSRTSTFVEFTLRFSSRENSPWVSMFHQLWRFSCFQDSSCICCITIEKQNKFYVLIKLTIYITIICCRVSKKSKRDSGFPVNQEKFVYKLMAQFPYGDSQLYQNIKAQIKLSAKKVQNWHNFMHRNDGILLFSKKNYEIFSLLWILRINLNPFTLADHFSLIQNKGWKSIWIFQYQSVQLQHKLA